MQQMPKCVLILLLFFSETLQNLAPSSTMTAWLACSIYKIFVIRHKKDDLAWENKNTHHEVSKTAVSPPPPAVGSLQGCCCKCACSDCTRQRPRPFLRKTGQQHICPDRHKSKINKKESLSCPHI